MQLEAGKIYSIYAPTNRQQYRDQSVPASITIEGGTINLFVSNTRTNTAGNIFDMQPDVDSPMTGTRVLFPRFGYLGYTVASGSPVVHIPDGVYETISVGSI